MAKKMPSWLEKSTEAGKASLIAQMKKAAQKDAKSATSKSTKNKKWIEPGPQSGVASITWVDWFVKKDNAECTAAPAPLSGRKAALAALVAADIEEAGVEREGRSWSARPKSWYCERLSVSERQLQRLVAAVPLVSRIKVVDGERQLFLRPGPLSDRTPEDYARIMAREWKQRVSNGKDVKRSEFGLLVGLAKDWEDIMAPDIFITALENWPAYMAGVKVAIAEAQVGGDHFEADPDKFMMRFYSYPSISVMRRFWQVGVELHLMLLQDMQQGKPSDLK
jgi:hypothetical protein